jgi:hypothetical protein
MATIVAPLILRGPAAANGALVVKKIPTPQGYYYPTINSFVFILTSRAFYQRRTAISVSGVRNDTTCSKFNRA